VVNPADVPTMSSEKLRKTDAVDSKKLAVSLRAKQLKGIYTPDSEALEIRSLIRLKNSITKDMTRQKNRIKSQLRYLGVEIPVEYLEPPFQLVEAVPELAEAGGNADPERPADPGHPDHAVRGPAEAEGRDDEETAGVCPHTERFEETLELLMTVPGIGQTTGLALMAEIVDISRFDNAEQLAAYVGMIPMCHSSAGSMKALGTLPSANTPSCGATSSKPPGWPSARMKRCSSAI
jgi:transposase